MTVVTEATDRSKHSLASTYVFTVSLAAPACRAIKEDNVSMQAEGSTQFSLKEMEKDSQRAIH